MLILLIFTIITLPVIAMGLPAALHAWPVAASSAVFALILAARLLDSAASEKAANDYQERFAAIRDRELAQDRKYWDQVREVRRHAAIDARDRRDLHEERQGHEREVRELREALKQAQERIQRMLGRRKKTPKPEPPDDVKE